MLDTKYALKYHMPHSLLHIVDNSMYTGELVPSVVDDPSLYSTIVVTGCPMGEDRKMVTLTRTDVAAAAFGLNTLTTDDIKRYGQSVEYPMSLLSRGQAPVRFMRVTPEDATYAFKTIVVQWRKDYDKNTMHVRFKEVDKPIGLRYELFKNTDRLNAALIANINDSTIIDPGTGLEWNQRVFMNVIAAGRGSVYNDMAFMIDLSSQNKRPINCRYNFTTYNTAMSAIVENFSASLINNTNNVDSIDSVNVTVKKRVSGSSILIPYVNENAIVEVYNAYMEFFKDMIAIGAPAESLPENTPSEYLNQIYALMNVNIFDIIYGNYIYNTEVDIKLPFYQVDMLDTDIIQLPESNRLVYIGETPTADTLIDQVYSQKLDANTIGVFAENSSVYVGDVYLSPTGSSNLYPTVNVIAAINQYSGAITYVPFSQFKLYDGNSFGDRTGTLVAYLSDITGVTDWSDDEEVRGAVATSFANLGSQIYKLYKSGVISGDGTDNVIAIVHPDENSVQTFDLYQISLTVDTSTGEGTFVVTSYTTSEAKAIYDGIDWTSVAGVGNVIGWNSDTTIAPAYAQAGYLRITNGAPGIVYYDNETAKPITNASYKFAPTPTNINIIENLIGVEYDVMAYENSDVKTVKASDVTIKKGIYPNKTSVYIASPQLPGMYFIANCNISTGALTLQAPIYKNATATFDNNTTFNGNLDLEDYTFNAYDAINPATGLPTGEPLVPDTGGEAVELDGKLVIGSTSVPNSITRYVVSGTQGSLFNVIESPDVIPNNYYSDEIGINPSTESGGFKLDYGYTGFFDDPTISSIEFKWRYQALLVKAYKGELDPRIKSTTRCPAKFLFDGGTNTILGVSIIPNVPYSPRDIISASTIFTEDEKDMIIYNPAVIAGLTYEDIDVKQAMYDLCIYRCYQGMPEDMRPVGPGYGLQLYLDSGMVDITTAQLMNNSFSKRFDNPNASWDIGGYVSSTNGISYTYTKWIVDNLFAHCKRTSINKPFAEATAKIPPTAYTSFFPDLDTSDWDLRELIYNSGGNGWIMDINGNLVRKSQRTMQTYAETSDLVQESNMRTLSQFCYLLQNAIDESLMDYSDDGVLRTKEQQCENMFSNWRGNLVQDFTINLRRDTNPTDGGDCIVAEVVLIFRGLILRAAIIVNVQRRNSTT